MTKEDSESGMELKHQLLEEMLTIGGNYKPDETKVVKSKLQDYAENNRNDLQIRDALIVLKTFEIESNYNDSETCCILSTPIFERLGRTPNWDFYDIRILACVIDYTKTLEQTLSLVEEIFDKLENYSYEKLYNPIKLNISINMTLRLLREKFSSTDNNQSEDELGKIFSEYANSAVELCDKTDIIHRAIVLVRKGIFYRDISLANEGFDLLKEKGEHEAYKLLQDEARDYKLTIHINENDKEQFDALLEELFTMGGNYKPEESKIIKSKLQSYAESYRDNLQIRDALIIHKIFEIESKHNDFETCYMLSMPIFERLNQTANWDLYDIRILTYVIDYAETLQQAHLLVTEVFDKLENYSHEKLYNPIKLNISINMTLRLIREKFSKKESRQSEDRLTVMFSEYVDLIMELCEEADIVRQAIVLVRKGIFYRNKSLATQGFNLLKANDEHDLYRILRDETSTYRLKVHLNKDDKQQFDILIGENIKNIRTKHNMTVSDMAKNLNMQQGPVSLIELGKRSASAYMLFSMATMFDEPVENFLYGTEVMLPDSDSDSKNVLIEQLSNLTKALPENEINHVIDMVKSLGKLRQ